MNNGNDRTRTGGGATRVKFRFFLPGRSWRRGRDHPSLTAVRFGPVRMGRRHGRTKNFGVIPSLRERSAAMADPWADRPLAAYEGRRLKPLETTWEDLEA